MYYYKLNEGAEGRTFIGVKTYPNGVMESENPIESPFVTEVQVETATEQVPPPAVETPNEQPPVDSQTNQETE